MGINKDPLCCLCHSGSVVTSSSVTQEVACSNNLYIPSTLSSLQNPSMFVIIGQMDDTLVCRLSLKIKQDNFYWFEFWVQNIHCQKLHFFLSYYVIDESLLECRMNGKQVELSVL